MSELKQFAEYEISRTRGFLADYEVDKVQLPAELQPAVDTAMHLPELICTGELRQHLVQLPDVDLSEFVNQASDAQVRMAMVHYTFMLQAWVWGEDVPSNQLPACLARPCYQLSQRTGQPPILTYSNYVLDNWAVLDPAKGIDLDNIRMLQPFLGGQDEAWFVLIHVAIEAAAGDVLKQMPLVIRACDRGEESAVTDSLGAIIEAWTKINAIFDRMPERCDPYIYFHRVRPWIHGFKDNPALPDGVVYQGVPELSEKGQCFRGQTGSQSSIVPSMDALLKINHAADPLKAYLDELHQYRPPSHRRFIDDVHASGDLRSFVKQMNKPSLIETYNECLEKLAAFRTKHLEYAASYINKQGKGGAGNHTDVGTGGTPFMRYLKKHRDEVNQNKL